jgi:tetratricopeptide (TPR) repeat protein
VTTARALPRRARAVASVLTTLAFAGLGCARPRDPATEAAERVERGYAPERLLELGRAHRRGGDATRAEQEFAAVLESRRATPEQRKAALRELLATCIEAQRLRVAIDYAEPELRRDPNDAALVRLVAALSAAVGDGPRARALYERLLALAPNDADAELGLARVHREAYADRPAAAEHYERYLALAPDGPHAVEARTFLAEARP